MLDLLDRRILFVGGKGGVGKTTVASALSLAAAERGKSCLLVSTDPTHSLGDIFERVIGDRETALAPGLWGLEIDPDAEARAHIRTVKQNMKSLVRPALYQEVDRQIDLASSAPGASEAALLERVAALMDEASKRYDLVIFDTAPTGHTIRLLSLPEVMAAWTDGLLRHQHRSDRLGRVLRRLGGGKEQADELSYIVQHDQGPDDSPASRIRAILLERRRKFMRARRSLLDPETTAFVLVLTPERLPILESRKALEMLSRFEVPVAAIVVNRVLPEDADGTFLSTRREQEAQYLREIEQTFARLPRHCMPLLERDVLGIRTLTDVARRLVGTTYD